MLDRLIAYFKHVQMIQEGNINRCPLRPLFLTEMNLSSLFSSILPSDSTHWRVVQEKKKKKQANQLTQSKGLNIFQLKIFRFRQGLAITKYSVNLGIISCKPFIQLLCHVYEKTCLLHWKKKTLPKKEWTTDNTLQMRWDILEKKIKLKGPNVAKWTHSFSIYECL